MGRTVTPLEICYHHRTIDWLWLVDLSLLVYTSKARGQSHDTPPSPTTTLDICGRRRVVFLRSDCLYGTTSTMDITSLALTVTIDLLLYSLLVPGCGGR